MPADAVVIGAGPNGLVAANLLAERGWEVVILEAEAEPGGAVRDAERAPGCRYDLFSGFYPLGAFSPEIVTRDAARRARFDQLLKQGKVKSARDYWMAALLFQHGATVDDIDRARTYAKKANALQSTCSTRRMMALTEDRWLMYQHKPQKYGTQFRGEPVDGGTPKWVLYEVDPTVTDAQRAKLCVGPLSEAVMP